VSSTCFEHPNVHPQDVKHPDIDETTYMDT